MSSPVYLLIFYVDCSLIKDVFVILDRPREHCILHGVKIMEQYFFEDAWKKESKKASNEPRKRLMDDDISVIVGPVAAPSEQVGMEFLDVPVQEGVAFAGVTWPLNWRS